jgi:hypothetical protein
MGGCDIDRILLWQKQSACQNCPRHRMSASGFVLPLAVYHTAVGSLTGTIDRCSRDGVGALIDISCLNV